jgi:hypothetical protein
MDMPRRLALLQHCLLAYEEMLANGTDLVYERPNFVLMYNSLNTGKVMS